MPHHTAMADQLDQDPYAAERTKWEREIAACRGPEDRHNVWYQLRSYLDLEQKRAFRQGIDQFKAFHPFRSWAIERATELRETYYPKPDAKPPA